MLSGGRGTRPEPGETERLVVVVPVHRPDHDRLRRLLMPSLEQNLHGAYDIWVICTDDSADSIRPQVTGPGVEVVDAADISPVLGALRRKVPRARVRSIGLALAMARRLGLNVRYAPELALRGWIQQQLVKLAVSEHLSTSFYLVLDADMICVRRTEVSELIVEGRAPIRVHGRVPPEQVAWHRWASELLGCEPLGAAMAMPGVFLATSVIRELVSEVIDRARGCRAAAWSAWAFPPTSNPVDALLAHLPWTEFSLYHTYLEREGLVDSFYRHSSLHVLGNALWDVRQRGTWSARPSLEQREPHVFCLVQPYAGLSVAELEHEFASVLPHA